MTTDSKPDCANSLAETQQLFVEALGQVKAAAILGIPALGEIGKRKRLELQEFVDASPLITTEKHEDHDAHFVPFAMNREYERLARAHQQALGGANQLPSSLFVSMLSQYEAHLGNIIRIASLDQPRRLASAKKSITYEEILSCSDIAMLKELIIDKEIEEFTRMSIGEQFKWFNSRAKIDPLTIVPYAQDVMEASLRRNNIVHCAGKVTRKYLESCAALDCERESLCEGESLKVKAKYFVRCHESLLTVGLILGYRTCRRVAPEASKKRIDGDMLHLIFEMLKSAQYPLAHAVSKSVLAAPLEIHNERLRRMFSINNMIALKRLGRDWQAARDADDWSASGHEFSLALAVLNEDYAEACKVMLKIGPVDDSVTSAAYQTWPLFDEFRQEVCFRESYEAVFDRPFELNTSQAIESLEDESAEPRPRRAQSSLTFGFGVTN